VDGTDHRELLGRDGERGVLRGLLRPGPATPHVAVVLGGAGTGRTALLRDTAAVAAERGIRVLPVPGLRAEVHLALAGLNRLLAPLADRARHLGTPLRRALETALEPDGADAAPWGQVAPATLALLRDAATPDGLVVLADDVEWLDPASRAVLSFVAHRVDDVPLTILAARRGGAAPADLPADTVHVALAGLPPTDAAALLDRTADQPEPVRRRVLALADGNPLALCELAATVPPDVDGRTDLPLTPRLVDAFAGAVGTLPEPTVQALLLAATAGGDRVPLSLLHAARPGTRDPEVWEPAETAGLIDVGPAGIAFAHPVTRAAVVAGATWGRRRACHLALAEAQRHDPERRVAHLLAAVPHPDDGVAEETERVAARADARGEDVTALAAWEAAAARSTDPAARDRRLVGALAATGRGDLFAEGLDLADQVRTLTADPAALAAADLARGTAALGRGRPREAAPRLVDTAGRALDTAPATAVRALLAAAAAHHHVPAADHSPVEPLLARLGDAVPEGGRLWCRAVPDPLGRRAEVLVHLHRARGGARRDPHDAALLGATAVLVDAPDLAVGFLAPLLEPGTALPHRARVAVLHGWACLDTGHGQGARHAAAAAGAATAGREHDLVWISAAVLGAAVAVRAEDLGAARELAGAALAALDTADSTALSVRAHHVLGTAALLEGDHDTALRALSALFAADGAPRHPWSWYGLADLTLAARGAERTDPAVAAVEQALRTWPATVSPRLRLLLLRSRALLDDGAAEDHLRVALAGSVPRRWPVEHALARLDLGRRLRRRRRIGEARVELSAAAEALRRAGARGWAAHAEAELRAAGQGRGHRSPGQPGRPVDGADVLGALSAQQRQIVRLAAYGLTNREIGERLYLSPRTVGSHLYRVFPGLGVTTRSQLRDVIERTD
jgi:DNA-binding CsgD family transcriptional regulator/tetratricopeptide (TPR) repeat protein